MSEQQQIRDIGKLMRQINNTKVCSVAWCEAVFASPTIVFAVREHTPALREAIKACDISDKRFIALWATAVKTWNQACQQDLNANSACLLCAELVEKARWGCDNVLDILAQKEEPVQGTSANGKGRSVSPKRIRRIRTLLAPVRYPNNSPYSASGVTPTPPSRSSSSTPTKTSSAGPDAQEAANAPQIRHRSSSRGREPRVLTGAGPAPSAS